MTSQQSTWRARKRVVRGLWQLMQPFAAEELEVLAAEVERVAQPAPRVSAANTDLVRALSGRDYTEHERRQLEILSVLERFRRRQELLQGALTTTQVANLLGTSRQTPYDRARAGSLLALQDRGALRFPAWQFDPEGPDGLVNGLPRVLRTLRASPLAKMSWLTTPTPFLARSMGESRTPIEALRSGDVDRVLASARSVGAT